MKKLKWIAVLAVIFAAAVACGGKPEFNREVCDQLKAKIVANEQLTEADYNMMVDQLVAACDDIKSQTDAVKGDTAKEAALMDNREFVDKASIALGFAFYLEQHKGDLSDENRQKLDDAEGSLEGGTSAQ